MAYIQHRSGFKKVLYWTKEKMINHADQYSQAFSKEAVSTKKFQKVSYADYLQHNYPSEDEWKYSSFWYKDFDAMAHKTLIRQLISKWGEMSIETQEAYTKDMAVVDSSGTITFDDTPEIDALTDAEDSPQINGDDNTEEIEVANTEEVSLDEV